MKKLITAILAMFAFISVAGAAVPTEISDLATDVDTVWALAKDIILGVATFSILMTFVYKMRKRTG